MARIDANLGNFMEKEFFGLGSRLRRGGKGFEGHFADFDVAALALDADVTAGEGALGGFVHQFAVDVGGDFVAGADAENGVPLADGVFVGRTALGQGGVAILAAMFLGFRAHHQKQIALIFVLALHLDAGRPNVVRRLEVEKHAGVVKLWRDFAEAPFDREGVVAVLFFAADVTSRLARAMDDAVGHGPGLQWIGVLGHAESPAGEILAIEEFDVLERGDGGIGLGKEIQGGESQEERK